MAEGSVRRISLNRPKALHALNLEMVNCILKALEEWENDSSRIIVIDAQKVPEKNVFCAGGDVVSKILFLSGCE